MTSTAIDDLVRRARARRDLPPVDERRAIRVAVGVEATEIAAVCEVTAVTVHRWENGSREPQGEHRARYAELLAKLARAAR